MEARWEPERIKLTITCARKVGEVKTGEMTTNEITLFREVTEEGEPVSFGQVVEEALAEAVTVCAREGSKG